MRAVLFMCVQCYLCAFNVVYSEVSNKRPPAYYFEKFEDLSRPSPAYQFRQFSKIYIKKIDIYKTISHRCSLANSLRILGTPNSGGMPLYMKYNTSINEGLLRPYVYSAP